ncbi:MAG TPA: DUF4260 domain-containing protein [Rubrobacter sp.]|nr:DUF4260 domain-containing protein [Rubrobacter sp.]
MGGRGKERTVRAIIDREGETRHAEPGAGPRSRLTAPGALLRVEGGVLLVTSALFYWVNGGSWVLFALLILAPDLSMLGYLFGTKVGAATYNLAHTYALPAGLAVFGVTAGSPLAVSVALVWFAHIGMDRLVGYGLKYTSGFRDTHLDRV